MHTLHYSRVFLKIYLFCRNVVQ